MPEEDRPQAPENVCQEHDVNVDEIPGYDECPYCKEERRKRDMEMEMMARRSDPNMHNMVDAQANAIDHSRPRGP